MKCKCVCINPQKHPSKVAFQRNPAVSFTPCDSPFWSMLNWVLLRCQFFLSHATELWYGLQTLIAKERRFGLTVAQWLWLEDLWSRLRIVFSFHPQGEGEGIAIRPVCIYAYMFVSLYVYESIWAYKSNFYTRKVSIISFLKLIWIQIF